jgi:CRP/FNR family transcriptional regulator, cyclic AMP receptor protein
VKLCIGCAFARRPALTGFALLWSELLESAYLNLLLSAAQPTGLLALIAGALAAILIVVSAFVKTIIPLRWLAVGSNVGFVLYGALHPAWLVLALHLTLLPVNVFRAIEMVRLTRRVVDSSSTGDAADVWLRPYMRRVLYKQGEVIFHKGDTADHLYYLAQGRIEFVEAGHTISEGRIFGEIAFFAPDRKRTSTGKCLTACTILRIDETTFKQLYFQNPDFGFEVVRLIAGRLTRDVQRLETELSTARARALDGVITPTANPPH